MKEEAALGIETVADDWARFMPLYSLGLGVMDEPARIIEKGVIA